MDDLNEAGITTHAQMTSINFYDFDMAMITLYQRAVGATSLRSSVMKAISVARDELNEPFQC